jgi:hypothetical protein
LEKKLAHFREFGFVILENLLPVDELNAIWDEVEYISENHQNYDIKGLAHRFNEQKETPIKLIPKDKLKGIGTRFIDYHDSSVRSKRLITHPSLSTFLKAVPFNTFPITPPALYPGIIPPEFLLSILRA